MQAMIVSALVSLSASTFWTANDPFVGKWKLDVSRSTIVDAMRIEGRGSNTYAFTFEGGPAETIVADGTDQPGISGTTLAVKAEDAHHLSVVRKQDGGVVVSARWTLSQDGRTLNDDFTAVQADGSKLTVNYVYKRTGGASGFVGDWESTTKPAGLKLELEIQPYGNEGLRFVSTGLDKKVTFDGRHHAVSNAKDGPILSGRRSGPRAVEYSESNGRKVRKAVQFQLSRDARTLIETVRLAGQTTPDVLVFERE